MRRIFSVSDANALGVSRLLAEVRARGDVVLVRNSRPEAALISPWRYDLLQKLDEADGCATYVLAFARYLVQHHSAQPVPTPPDGEAARTAVRVVPAAAAELAAAAPHEQAMLIAGLNEIAVDPTIGVLCGRDQVPAVRTLDWGRWRVAYATAPGWTSFYAVEFLRHDTRDCFDRMGEATALLGVALATYGGETHFERDGTPKFTPKVSEALVPAAPAAADHHW